MNQATGHPSIERARDERDQERHVVLAGLYFAVRAKLPDVTTVSFIGSSGSCSVSGTMYLYHAMLALANTRLGSLNGFEGRASYFLHKKSSLEKLQVVLSIIHVVKFLPDCCQSEQSACSWRIAAAVQ